MRRRRTRSAPNSTAQRPQYGGLAAVAEWQPNQILARRKNTAIEVGTKMELFNRHLLVTAALFQTEKEMRGIAEHRQRRGSTPELSYPIGTVGSVSCISAGAAYRIRGIDLGVGARSLTNGACSATWC